MGRNEEEFKRLYLGEFTPSQRDIELYDRLLGYYKNTPDSMSNRSAMVEWRLFKKWCDDHNYSQQEINAMKRQIPPQHA